VIITFISQKYKLVCIDWWQQWTFHR